MLGNCWISLMKDVLDNGIEFENDFLEVSNKTVSFSPIEVNNDLILNKYANKKHITEMEKVFFSDEKNNFGHSYRKTWRGPSGENDLSDIIDMLKRKVTTKRAILTFESNALKTPCINILHFISRDNKLTVSYFSRGQDVFNKFYADAYCIQKFGKIIADAIHAELINISGFISSAHIYIADMEKSKTIINQTETVK